VVVVVVIAPLLLHGASVNGDALTASPRSRTASVRIDLSIVCGLRRLRLSAEKQL